MSKPKAALKQAIEHGETDDGNVEFKTKLTKQTHLGARRASLTAQLRHRVLSGDGEAIYVIGVNDTGEMKGITQAAFDETVTVVSTLAQDAGACIRQKQTWQVDDTDRIVGLLTLVKSEQLSRTSNNHIVIGSAGHVDHGKSTLIGSLVTGNSDDGQGGTRSFLDVKPHEIERGLSADLSYAVYGFDAQGNTLTVDDPTRNADRSGVVEDADKVVSFVDTVGHEPWLRTTIRGIVGQQLDYGLLAVSADDGPTQTTREHLGILLATNLPSIVAVTKTDLVEPARVTEVIKSIEQLLRDVGCTPLRVRRHGVDAAINEISEDVIPIVETSAVELSGMDTLNNLFQTLPSNTGESGAFEMYIDRTYNVSGVGTVASGTIKSGTVSTGDELILGPLNDGSFVETKARSIEIHYHRVSDAHSGQLVSIALQNVRQDLVRRGMVLAPRSATPTPSREFEAELMVLNHPTKITSGYEPVVHLETIGEVASIQPADDKLLPGDSGAATLKFKFNPYVLQQGQRFVFREGKSKGVGTITDIPDGTTYRDD